MLWVLRFLLLSGVKYLVHALWMSGCVSVSACLGCACISKRTLWLKDCDFCMMCKKTNIGHLHCFSAGVRIYIVTDLKCHPSLLCLFYWIVRVLLIVKRWLEFCFENRMLSCLRTQVSAPIETSYDICLLVLNCWNDVSDLCWYVFLGCLAVKTLLDNLIELQTLLLIQNPETKYVVTGQKGTNR